MKMNMVLAPPSPLPPAGQSKYWRKLFLTLSFRRALECSAAEARERELAIWHQAQLNEAKARDEFKHRRDHPRHPLELGLELVVQRLLCLLEWPHLPP